MQRELFVSFNKIGDVQKKNRDFEGALCSYQGGLQIAESLACGNTANNEWQHDLSVSRNRIGDVLMAQGDTDAAFASYRRSLDILDTLCSRDPGNTDWQDNLRWTKKRLGMVPSVRQSLIYRLEPQVEVRRSFAFCPEHFNDDLGSGSRDLSDEFTRRSVELLDRSWISKFR